MEPDLTLLIFGLYCTGVYYLLARARITRWLWSRLDSVPAVGELLRCPACAGFWIGLGMSHAYAPMDHWCWGYAPCALFAVHCGVLGMVLTAVIFGLMRWGLNVAAVEESDEQ